MSRPIGFTLILTVIALAGCERQVGSEYQGESLLRISGSVAVPLGFDGSNLVPVIAFLAVAPGQSGKGCAGGTRYDHMQLVDVGVEGDFPSNFALDVYDPPPAEALRQVPGLPPIAFGYVAAVRGDHPAALLTRPNDQATFDDWRAHDEADCEAYYDQYDGEGETAPGACVMRHSCTLDGERCLHRTLSCPATGAPLDENDCETAATNGDESLAVAGYSVNYQVIYFADEVPTGAFRDNAEPIAAGYHLYRFVQDNPAQSANPQCTAMAVPVAVERINARYGTDHTFTDLVGPYTHNQPRFEVSEDFLCELRMTLQEAGCYHPVTFTAEDADSDPISIELSTVAPYSFM